jgi:hypothetical protein
MISAGGDDSGGDDEAGQFESIMRGLRDPEARIHPARVRYREILGSRGAMGASPKMLLEQLLMEDLRVERETLQRWLADDCDEQIIHKADYGRYRIGPGEEKGSSAA